MKDGRCATASQRSKRWAGVIEPPACSGSNGQKSDHHTIEQGSPVKVLAEGVFHPQNKTAAAICQRPTGHDNVLRDKKSPSSPVVLPYADPTNLWSRNTSSDAGTRWVWRILHVEITGFRDHQVATSDPGCVVAAGSKLGATDRSSARRGGDRITRTP